MNKEYKRTRATDALGALVVALLGVLASFVALGIAYALGFNTRIFSVLIPVGFAYKFITVYFKNRAQTINSKGK